MARDREGRTGKPRGRLTRSGHTSHTPRVPAPSESSEPTPYRDPPPAQDRRQLYDYDEPSHDDLPTTRYAPVEPDPAPREPFGHERYYGRPSAPELSPSQARRDVHTRPYDDRPPYDDRGYGDGRPDDAQRAYAGAGSPPPPTVAGGAKQIGKAALRGTNTAARTVTRKVITASKADGADKSGLTALVWNQVLSYGTDAMITVALAGTVFFGASSHAQRGNVLLYLVITMAPFALIAPIIGPALDRLQHGRRWTMAGTAIGRCVLALVMASHPTELLVLYPCALGSLVLSKAYGVVRAAAAPRLVPPGMSLTQANSRVTIFGLGSTVVLGGFVGILIKVTGSYSLGLIASAVGFAACAFFAFGLPRQVDSAVAAPIHPEEPSRPRREQKVPPLARIHSWARRGFDPHLVIALQGESALRLLSALLTIYLAFYVETTSHGLTAALELGLVVGATGVGNFIGSAIGTRLSMERPELIVALSVIVSGAVCLLIAIAFDPLLASVAMLVASVGNAMCKVALDALIQRDVVETLRSSAFARSETFLQLAWVIGAAIGVVLPSERGDGPIGFIIAGSITVVAGVVIVLRRRAMTAATARNDWQQRPDGAGTVVPRSVD